MTSPAREHRPFLLNYKSEDINKLVRRATDGIRSNKFRPQDYDKLRAQATEKKFSAHKSMLKMRKLEQMSKQTKENNLLRQHKLVWQREFMKLNSQRKRYHAELDIHTRQNYAEGSVCSHIYQDFDDVEADLETEFNQFKQDTTEPVWNLREDLQYWLQENFSELKLGNPETLEKHAEIKNTVHSVKEQQRQVLERLHHEQICLEQELLTGELGQLTQSAHRPHIPSVHQGIPEEAFDLECPDENLKISVLQEFIMLDEKYLEHLDVLDSAHAMVLNIDEFGGWTEDDHMLFIAIFEQYPHEMANRRVLLLDRLKRQLSHKTRTELVRHEEWWDSLRYYRDHQKAIILDWQRDRRELFDKARSIFTEACIAHELDEVKAEYVRKQKELCDALYDKVRVWREQKLEMMAIQIQMAERKREEIQEKLQQEREKEQQKKNVEKLKIQKFQADRAEQRRLQEERDQRRMKELNRIMAEQAVFDMERVKYRDEQLQQKLEERNQQEEEKKQEDIAKEMRLEALREQVRVIAESDPERIQQQTQAWQAHHAEDNEEINIQQPLFEIHGFTAKQVTADRRVLLEQRLREAGVHNTDYARHVMSKIPPPQQPRRDTESTVFKNIERT